MTPTRRFAWPLAVGSAAALVALAGARLPAPPDDDPDEAAIAAARDLRLFEHNCLMCHSAEMTTAQRLTRAQWTAEVEKMVRWGAPVAADDVALLTDHLARSYPADAAPAQVARLGAAEARALEEVTAGAVRGGDVGRGGALYKAHCATCHGPEGRGGDLGTNLVEKPILLQPDRHATVVRDGLRRMPGFKAVLSPEQETDILAWLRTL